MRGLAQLVVVSPMPVSSGTPRIACVQAVQQASAHKRAARFSVASQAKHGPLMIKKDEEIISALEQLDSTYSQINRVLKQIKRKVDEMEESNRALIGDCHPWCRFFGLEGAEAAETAETQEQLATDTQSFLKHSSPVNPFCRGRGSKADANVEKGNGTSETFADGSMQASDTMVSELVDFDQELLPDGFREIDEVRMIYHFIEKRRTVSVEEVYERFSSVSRELMDILLDVLIRKSFVRLEENRLSV